MAALASPTELAFVSTPNQNQNQDKNTTFLWVQCQHFMSKRNNKNYIKV